MSIKLGINGFGRIGRLCFRALLEREEDEIEIVGINDLTDAETLAPLLKYDSVHGQFPGDVHLEDSTLVVDEQEFPVFSEKDPTNLPWGDHDTDVVIESTGVFRTYDKASQHLEAGADQVVISAPAKSEVDAMVVLGVNDEILTGDEKVVSNASCTTNCLAPLVKVLDDAFGVESGLMTTVHAYTASQNIVDGPKSKTRRGRAAAENIVPTTTGASTATPDILPELKGKFEAMAIRVPTPSGSITEIVADLEGNPSADEINAAMEEYANGELEGSMGAVDDEIVSRDILGWEYGSAVDLNKTSTVEGGDLAKIFAWYDNEMGYTAQMMRLAEYIA